MTSDFFPLKKKKEVVETLQKRLHFIYLLRVVETLQKRLHFIYLFINARGTRHDLQKKNVKNKIKKDYIVIEL